MSGSDNMLDLRLPSGLFFVLTGAMLTGMGLLDSSNQAPLQQANVNLDAGLVQLVFGGFLLLLARRARSW
jgi:predicted transporter